MRTGTCSAALHAVIEWNEQRELLQLVCKAQTRNVCGAEEHDTRACEVASVDGKQPKAMREQRSVAAASSNAAQCTFPGRYLQQ